MKNLNDLLDLIAQVQKQQIERNYFIKASLNFSMTYYSDEKKYLYSFDYGLEISGKKVSYIFNPKKVSNDEIQMMYYNIKVNCLRD